MKEQDLSACSNLIQCVACRHITCLSFANEGINYYINNKLKHDPNVQFKKNRNFLQGSTY